MSRDKTAPSYQERVRIAILCRMLFFFFKGKVLMNELTFSTVDSSTPRGHATVLGSAANQYRPDRLSREQLYPSKLKYLYSIICNNL